MKTIIEQLNFPCKLKEKSKMKIGTSNLDIQFIEEHILDIDKTNHTKLWLIIKNNAN